MIKNFPRYLWGGWGALSSLFLFIALWEIGHDWYGELVLPSPLSTFFRVVGMFQSHEMIGEILITLKRAFIGFFTAIIFGTSLGLFAGFFATASIMSRPIVTILMGMPPIAWIVLAMIWFGMGDGTVVFTVVVASFPIVFMGALQGTRTLENHLTEMGESFKTPFLMKLTDIYFPHIFSYIFPAWVTALGMSWKIVVMSELLSTNDGLGAALAVSRSQLDTTGALALVMVSVGSLLMVEYLILEPIRREVEQWRD